MTDIRSKRDSTEQMKYLLEEWSIKGGTLTQLEDALFHIGKKDVISGMFSSVNDIKYYYYCDLIVRFTCSTRQEECTYYFSVQISTDKLNKDSTGNPHITCYTLSSSNRLS